MLIAKPHHLFSWSFVVYDSDGNERTDLSIGFFRERGRFELQGKTYEVRRTDMFHGTFELYDQSELPIAHARKPNMLMRRFEIGFEGEAWELAARHPFTRRFVLRREERELGYVHPMHPFTRTAEIDFPEEIPLEKQVFLFWLVVILWRRAASNNSAAGGAGS
jgi:hypothetical protein